LAGRIRDQRLQRQRQSTRFPESLRRLSSTIPDFGCTYAVFRFKNVDEHTSTRTFSGYLAGRDISLDFPNGPTALAWTIDLDHHLDTLIPARLIEFEWP